MSSSTLSTNSSQAPDQAVWASLKQAIASSSGFQQWKQDSDPTPGMTPNEELEGQVRGYLRETLETLAY
jgi:hypothetical protein